MAEKFRRVCSICLEHDVKWTGTTPFGESYMCAGGCRGRVTPSKLAVDSPDEGVTFCAVCSSEISGYSNKKTCSSKCRKKLSRMIGVK